MVLITNVRQICIECFTTTFLHAHSWQNWVDEDEVYECVMYGMYQSMLVGVLFNIKGKAGIVFVALFLLPLIVKPIPSFLRKARRH